MRVALRFVILLPAVLGLAGCLNMFGGGGDAVPVAQRQLPSAAQALLAVKGMTQDAPIFIRIFKQESELEVWKFKDGRFQHFKTYKICAWSGTIGPKVQQGDRQAPEGFYTVGPGQLNPNSLYHLAFNIGFPNLYDRANNHSGSALMVHGDCKSVGCYAMTDAYIEEIYILARDALAAGQKHFHVHAFPFRMTQENLQAHRDSPWYPFWVKLKEGYDSFEATGKPPVVKVCSKQYLVNVQFNAGVADPAPDAMCPAYSKIDPDKVPGIEGVPPTLLASLAARQSQGQQSQPQITSAPQVAALSNSPQLVSHPAELTPDAAPDMSFSPVITRPAEPPPLQTASIAPVNLIASPKQTPPTQPRTLAAQVTPTPNKTLAVTAKLPPMVGSLATPASLPKHQPITTAPGLAQPQTGTAAGFQTQTAIPVQSDTHQVMAADAPSKYVDPDALQKPNRSGKGGKLTVSQPTADGQDGTAPAQTQSVGAQSSLGFNGQVR